MKSSQFRAAGVSLLLASLLLTACSGTEGRKARESALPARGPSGRSAEPPRNIVIVETAESVAAPGAEARAAPLRRPLPAGREPIAERLGAFLLELAADPEIEAIILAPAPRGSAEAFLKAHEARPGLLLIAAAPEEEPLLIQSSADLVAELRGAEPANFRAFTEGLAELARRVARKGARLDGLEDLVAALRSADPATRWSASYYVDPESGLRARNQVLVEAAPKDSAKRP